MKHEESRIQAACVEWFRMQYGQHKNLLFAIPNGGARSLVTGAILKREGVLAGVADLFLAIPSQGEPGMFIEMKTPAGRQSKSQAEFMLAVTEQGYRYRVVRSLAEFISEVDQYLMRSR